MKMSAENPIDLLYRLDPILGNTGCLRSSNDINLLVKFMEGSSLMIYQCTVINILKNTRAPSTLERFVDSKGWEYLSNWVKNAKDRNETPFLIELIQVLVKFPQTIESLKQGNIGKIVKQLSKSDNFELQKISKNVLIKWKRILKDNQRSTKNICDKAQSECIEGTTVQNQDYFSTKVINSVSCKTIANRVGSLAPKLHSSQISEDNDYIHKFEKTDSQKLFRTTKSIREELALKRARVYTEPELKPEITESQIDKDDENFSQHRILSSPNSLKHSNTPTEYTTLSDKFYGFKPECYTNQKFSSKPSSNLLPKNIAVPSMKSSSVESKKFSAAIFESTNRKSSLKRIQNSPNRQKLVPDRPSYIFESSNTSIERDITGVNQLAENDVLLSNYLITKSNLSTQFKPLVRKHVTWAPDESLTEVRYIELDETEINSIPVHGSFHDAIKQEKRAERSALAHIFANDRMLALVQWTTPKLIEFLEPLIESGSKSEEFMTQSNRELSVLALLFLTKDCAPDDPGEPDLEDIHIFKEPKIIPLFEPGKEPQQENSSLFSDSPVKLQCSLPNKLIDSDLPRSTILNTVAPFLPNVHLIPVASQFPIINSNIIPGATLHPTTNLPTNFYPPNQAMRSFNPKSFLLPNTQFSRFTRPINQIVKRPVITFSRSNFKNLGKGRGRGKKTKLCQHYLNGFCKKGESCDYHH